MGRLLRPAQDVRNLRAAIRERLLRTLGARSHARRVQEGAPSGAHRGQEDVPGREEMRPPLGSDMWAGYLLEVEAMRQYGEISLTAEEVHGLMILEEERQRVREEYQPCPKCRAFASRLSGMCPRGHKLE